METVHNSEEIIKNLFVFKSHYALLINLLQTCNNITNEFAAGRIIDTNSKLISELWTNENAVKDFEISKVKVNDRDEDGKSKTLDKPLSDFFGEKESSVKMANSLRKCVKYYRLTHILCENVRIYNDYIKAQSIANTYVINMDNCNLFIDSGETAADDTNPQEKEDETENATSGDFAPNTKKPEKKNNRKNNRKKIKER